MLQHLRRQPGVEFRQGNHAQGLGEIGVARRAHQEPVGLAARLAGISSDPRPLAAAEAEGNGARACRLVQRPFRAAIAYGESIADIAAAAAFLQPQGTLAVCAAPVDERAPVQIVDMPPPTTAHEAHRHDGLPAAVIVVEAPPVEMFPTDQPTTAPMGVFRRRPVVLDDEPDRKDARTDRSRSLDIFLVERRRAQFEARYIEQLFELGD